MMTRRPVLVLAAALAVVMRAAPSSGCSTFLAGARATSDGSLFVTHSDDGEGNPDVRLSYVPAADHAPGSERLVWPDLEDNPRFVGRGRGTTYSPDRVPPGTKLTEPIGSIPQVNHTFAYTEGNYGVMNERQLSIGESTCSGAFAAKAAGAGGEALFCVNELSRVAMERCATARCAVETMGDLAVRYGFYGASGSFEGGSEALLIADTNEGWVMHFVPYPDTNSAVWVAQRVPDDEVTVVMNMFTIRRVDLDDPANFLYSDNMIPVAVKHGLWDPRPVSEGGDGPFDFTRAYSDGEYAHKFYSGRRVWGAFRLINPTVELDPEYGDLRFDAPYPFSMKPAKPLKASDLFAMHRDWYEGTPFDMTKGLAAGPFGSPDRFNGGAGEEEVPGAFERSITLHRTTYTHVLQTRGWLPDAVGGITWFGPHAAHGTCFVPIPAGAVDLPPSLTVGNATEVDRSSQWWAHRYVHNLAQLKYSYASKDVKALQDEWEAKGEALVAEMDAAYRPGGGASDGEDKDKEGGLSRDQLTALVTAHAEAVKEAWWRLADTLMVQYADGFLSMPGQKGGPGAPVGYPAWWLKKVGWREGPPPPPQPPKRGPSREDALAMGQKPSAMGTTDTRAIA